MKYIANKTVRRYLNEKKTVIITKGEKYSEEFVNELPRWYLDDNILSPIK